MAQVAIIGAGAAGLVTARFLQSEGFGVTLFEKVPALGGQWSGDSGSSSVWQSMHTNSSRITTAFSDLTYPPGTAIYPSATQVGSYLRRYADLFSLTPRIRFSSPVLGLLPDVDRWRITTETHGEETFDRVVVSTGLYQTASSPSLPGIESFSGSAGVSHARQYASAERYRGLRVLVLGCGVSSLEIASDLAMSGAGRVLSSFRRQRFILPKFISGIPTDNLVFSRYAALAEESLPLTEVTDAFQRVILQSSGSPEQYGARKPASSLLEAGVTQSQFYLPLVAEDRITVKPWIERIDGRVVHFIDGFTEEVDAIILATGYSFRLPFLAPQLQAALGLNSNRLDLHRRTFHPAAPNAAFVGLFGVLGPQFPVLELQARYLAYTWSGARPMPSPEEMNTDIQDARPVPSQVAALMFARKARIEPDLADFPNLLPALLFGPLSAISFRLSGRDALSTAEQQVAAEAVLFGAIHQSTLTDAQRDLLLRIAAVRKDRWFTRLMEYLTPKELQCQ